MRDVAHGLRAAVSFASGACPSMTVARPRKTLASTQRARVDRTTVLRAAKVAQVMRHLEVKRECETVSAPTIPDQQSEGKAWVLQSRARRSLLDLDGTTWAGSGRRQ